MMMSTNDLKAIGDVFADLSNYYLRIFAKSTDEDIQEMADNELLARSIVGGQ